MDDLKKAFNAAREYKDHTFAQAATELGVSETWLHKFFKGDGVSAPLEEKIRQYINESGVVKSIQRLGLDSKKKVKAPTA